MSEVRTLSDRYPEEQARCRELVRAYHELGPVGAFGAAYIEAVLRRADAASAAHDTVAMLGAFKDMQECE
jgi:hypothetical protein